MTKTPRPKRKRSYEKSKIWFALLAFVFIVFCLGVVFGCFICTAFAPVAVDAQEEIAQPPIEADTMEVINPDDVLYAMPIRYGQRELDNDLWKTMVDLCRTYDVPPALALAVAEQESGFNPDAVSMTNDHGLMQINEINFTWLRSEGIEPLNYEGNIEAGILMLSKAINAHGDYHHALMAYNCGDAGARKLWGQGIHSSNYSRAIMERFSKWDAYIGGI